MRPSRPPVRPAFSDLLRVGVFAVALVTSVPVDLAAQGPAGGRGSTACRWLEGTREATQSTFGLSRVFYLSRPRIGCDDGVRIEADSAVVYESQRLTQLFGNVRFQDATREMRSDEARYFSELGRLQGTGNLYIRDPGRGSEIRDGDLVYLRATETRTTEEMTVTTGTDGRRPQAVLYLRPEEPAPEAQDSIPYHVVGDRLFLVGQGYFRASGRVEIDRDSLHAVADTAQYDRAAERMLLEGSARVETSTYDLQGRTINVAMPGGQVDRIRARREAILTGRDLRLTAPVIDLFMTDGTLDRLVAVPERIATVEGEPPPPTPDSALTARPVAVAEGFRITADSLDVRAPAQTLERIDAVGTARGESSRRDSLNVEVLPDIARTDWMEGDTVVARFVRVGPPSASPAPPADGLAAPTGSAPSDSLAVPADSTAGYALDELVAAGDARSLYRLEPSDSTARPGQDPPAVHYVTGNRITIRMVRGEVDAMEVEGQTHGYHLEPLSVARGAAADSLTVDSVPQLPLALDTVPPVPDTAGAERPAPRDAPFGSRGNREPASTAPGFEPARPARSPVP